MYLVHKGYRKQNPRVKKKVSEAKKAAVANRWERTKAEAGSSGPSQDVQPTDRSTTPTSSKKIDLFSTDLSDKIEKDKKDFFLLQRGQIQNLVSEWRCGICEGDMTVEDPDVNGFCRKLSVKCSKCSQQTSEVWTSDRVAGETGSKRPPFLANRKMVESFLAIGQGFSAMERFAIESGITPLSSRGWKLHVNKIVEKNKALKKEILDKARNAVRVQHGLEDSDEILDLVVSFDGTWQKRGHQSLNGCAFVIDIVTELVIDWVVLSKYCSFCAMHEGVMEKEQFLEWRESHKETGECQINYEGSAGGMEVAAAEIMWLRSMDHNMRYTGMLADGDTKTFNHLCEIQPYGDEVNIEKEECVNHIAKRIGTGLRDIRKDEGLGGRGEGTLKDVSIDKLTTYYRKAIISNLPNVQEMQREILAAIYHCSSTDKAPKHNKYCPKGPESWCFWQKAKALKERPKPHQEMSLHLSQAVVKAITPLYVRLSSTSLLERCCRGATQNANESLHAQVWRLCKKEVFVTKPRLELGTAMAVSEFNMGAAHAVELRKEIFEEEVAKETYSLAMRRDAKRKEQSAQQEVATKKRFVRKQTNKKKATERKKKPEGGDAYKAGGF